MCQDQKIKQSIQYMGIEIRLFEVSPYYVPFGNVSNILAVDSVGKIVWRAQSPVTHHKFYWDMELDNCPFSGSQYWRRLPAFY